MAEKTIAPATKSAEQFARQEAADNKLCQAQAILQLVMQAAELPESNALWGAFDLIEEARNLRGKV